MKYSGIGGQAVIEGVMMKNQDNYAVAVRKPDGEIVIKNETYNSLSKKMKIFQLPFFRGMINFIDSMILGMSTLTFSTSFYEDENSKEQTEQEKKKSDTIFNIITILAATIIAIGVFMVGPYFISLGLSKWIQSDSLLILIEGLIRLTFFIIYVWGISFMSDIQRVYMYHGAEHKCINCIEGGKALNVDNVRNSSKEHKRCGTSFMLIVMCVSIFVLMLVRVDSQILRALSRVVLIPVIAGISYEFLRLAGTHDNKIINALSKPGLLLQKLTTKEPDDKMIEVGIASVEAVFDWKAYLSENFKKNDE